MNYKKVVVAGGGVLGSQIAFQAAYCGFDVTIWLRSEGSVKRCQAKIDDLKETYIKDIKEMAKDNGFWARGLADKDSFDKDECLKKVEKAYETLKLVVDKKEAYAGADLVIESMAEITEEKIAYYKDLGQYLDEKTVIVTNSSTLLPSTFAKYTGRPEKFLSLHFANHIWKQNTAEVMAQAKTDSKYFAELVEFANAIRMVALPVLKEKNGYLLNSMLVPFLLSGMDLVAGGVSDPVSVDKAWTLGTGSPRGPFQIVDVVGVQTAYNIVLQFQKVPGLLSPLLKKMMMPYNFKAMLAMLKAKLDAGETGVAAGKGFYDYTK
ncbi:MAG: 3-hydroxyacyl-CoA dehydrogenase [Bacilli bacterium]|nr:3-hydroxyacyl-CoA dehydrogenase [Bacilli bacterium]